jgi:serine/threonine-protein kinase
MNIDQLKQVKFLFEQAINLNTSEENAYLDKYCTDLEVRKEVEALLAKNRTASQFTPKDKTYEDTNLKQDSSQNSSETYSNRENPEENHSHISLEEYFNYLIGKTLNNTYRIEEKIGEGGMGTVFRASHLLLGGVVAIKVMNPSPTQDKTDIKRFQREARAGWSLSHPNIIKVLEFSQTQEGTLFMVMEYLGGENLKSYIRRAAPLSINRCFEILKPICEALDVAHRRNILHRDIKPANIIIGQQNNTEIIKLADFGIIKLLAPNKQITTEGTALTDGAIIGTLNYMSPEQIMDYNLGPTCDIYSLGVVFHEMLTRTIPVEGSNLREILSSKSNFHKLPPPSTIFPFLSPSLDKILKKVLAPMPQHRYQKAGEFLEDIKNCL